MKLKKFIYAKMAALVLATMGLGVSSFAAAAPAAVSINFDWSSLTAQVSSSTEDAFSFVTDDGSYGTSTTAFSGGATNYASSIDWTTVLSTGDSVANASASATTLTAQIVGGTPSASTPYLADVTRSADFTLAADSEVTFTINATTSMNLSADSGNTAFASLSAIGGDAGYAQSDFYLVGTGVTQSQSGLLSITFDNTSDSAVEGFLSVEGTATVDAVPESPTFALMLGSLLVMGACARRRRA